MDEFVNWDSPAGVIGSTSDSFNVNADIDDNMLINSNSVFPADALNVDHMLVSPQDREVSLLFENPDADDFSFCAIEHYEQSNLTSANLGLDGFPSLTGEVATETDVAIEALLQTGVAPLQTQSMDNEFCPAELWGMPDQPCVHCQIGGYQCKTIQEGSYKGYCTSCVALRCECSFGLANSGPIPTNVSFPPNPWPILGDHPDPIRHDEETMHAVSELASSKNTHSEERSSSQQGRSSPSALESAQPKLGARFSRESVRILKNWVSTHSRHPYPTEEEKESLQRLTGLNKTQISNWLANARRRGKIPTTRSTSPHVRNSYSGPSGPVDIPQPRRSGTPSPFDRRSQESENIPLQRWANSPPENEPASVTDIARAITSSSSAISSGLNSPLSYNFTDDGSGRSLFNGSSTSSIGTSQSSGGGSFASAYSHVSRGSFGSNFSSMERGRRRRRRRSANAQGRLGSLGSAGAEGREETRAEKTKADKTRGRKRAEVRASGSTPLIQPLKTYQCTFCTETFKTKHDWQRHEKSLHLSLERWICTPHGPVATNPETKQKCCVFCDQVDPDADHIESHNFGPCQERALADQTFYRKDHLRQHLKLVHGVKFLAWSMEQWKVATPEIRSRCGFCGIVMDTWSIRIDHLADHFKTGRTMADWKGDWGFEQPVMAMVENSIPPYLIHDERNSPLPFSAVSQSPGSPRNAYELLRGELCYWFLHKQELKQVVTDEEMRVEACRIVLAAEINSDPTEAGMSWLRDLLFADEECTQKACLSPVRGQAESRMANMRINGKSNVFDSCPLEAHLQVFVKNRSLLGLTPRDTELQIMACDVIRKTEVELLESDDHRAQVSTEQKVTEFWLRLIRQSTGWLTSFRKRAHLPRSEAMADELRRPVNDPNSLDATIHNDSRLQVELADFVRLRRAAGQPTPDDATLQRQARLIIFEQEDGWNQTAADDPKWLEDFKRQHMEGTTAEDHPHTRYTCDSHSRSGGSSTNRSPNFIIPSPFFLNDTNCYRRLARELTRYTSMAMSPNNPNCHIPDDQELQHQARWILYDDDDPWNQTAADNAEWLIRFKRDVGILPAEDGPGLPIENKSWNLSQGGSGFAPPYCFPKTPLAPFSPTNQPTAQSCSGSRDVSPSGYTLTAPSAANKYLQSFMTRYAKPATVFCSRELEDGLADYVRTTTVLNGQPFPDDEALRAKAREVLKCAPGQTTPADDKAVLDKFREMMTLLLADELAQKQPNAASALNMPFAENTSGIGGMDVDMSNMNVDLNLDQVTQEDMDNIFQEMSFEFEDGVDLV